MPSRNRKKRSKQRAEYLQKQDDILSQENKAKPRPALQGRSRKEEGLCTRQLQGRSRKEEGLCTRQLQTQILQSAKRQRYQEDLEENRAAKRQRYQEDVEENRAAKRQRYQEGVEENRAAKRQRYQKDVEENRAVKGRNTRTIQLSLRHLKGIDIGMTPLSDWLNVLPRGSGIAGVTELPLPPKGLSTETVDLNGRCVVAEEIGDRDKDTMHPLK
eukprot:Em0006g1532a